MKMKVLKIVGIVFMALTIVSPFVAFFVAFALGRPKIFGIEGIIKYSRVMWRFIPVGLVSLAIGLVLKLKNRRCRGNFISAFIVLPLLILFGSYRYIFTNITYDSAIMDEIGQTINMTLPNKVYVVTNKTKGCTVSRAEIFSDYQRLTLKNTIIDDYSELWQYKLSPEIQKILPFTIQIEAVNFQFYMLYNVSTGEYNSYSLTEKNEYVFVAFNYDANKLLVLSDYIIDLSRTEGEDVIF